jgi:hypothetical protein
VKIGDTFLRADSDRHLWVVLSDPEKDPENVLLVNMTTWNATKERACILHTGDHPWITHETCINYGDAVVTTLAKLLSAKDGGALRLHQAFAAIVVRRMLDGAAQSVHLALENAEILEQQGLIEI